MAYDLQYYSDVFATIDSIYRQELRRPCDVGGAVNWFYWVRERNQTGEWVREQIRQSAEWHAIHDKPQPVVLPRLVPAGSVFKLDTGGPFTAVQCSDFNLFGRYLIEGEDAVRQVLAERQAIGFNMLRVWSEYQGNATFTADIGRLVPGEHADYSAKLTAFLALASAYSFYVELTVFTGTGIPGHWARVGAVAQGATNVLLELANEVNAHPSIDPRAYQKITGVICSHGSNGSQAVPVRPAWDYETAHFNDAFQWPRKVGHNSMEYSVGADQLPASGKPVIANENTRPDKDGNINHFYDAAAGAALLCAGSCFHSQSGKRSSLFDSRDREFAKAWVAGAKSVPLSAQGQPYKHRMDLERPDAGTTGERIYQRGDDPAAIVKIRP
jgi:hypothetical protein